MILSPEEEARLAALPAGARAAARELAERLKDASAVATVAPSPRSAWEEDDKPFRVRYYDPSRRGTWFRYFEFGIAAREFASGKRVWSNPCKVELSPRLALEARECPPLGARWKIDSPGYRAGFARTWELVRLETEDEARAAGAHGCDRFVLRCVAVERQLPKGQAHEVGDEIRVEALWFETRSAQRVRQEAK